MDMYRRLRSKGSIGVGVLAVVALTSAACGQSVAPKAASSASSATTHAAPGSQHVTVNATNALRFQPSVLHVHPGVVTIRLVDTGAYPHNLDIPSLHVVSSTVSGTPGNTSTTFTVHVPKAGTYPFQCDFHSSAGMTGVLLAS